MKMTIPLALCAALLAGCSQMTQPEDVALASELCGKRGGFAHIARHERGRNILINCKDGTHLDVRLPKGA
jgi:putative hemolysin